VGHDSAQRQNVRAIAAVSGGFDLSAREARRLMVAAQGLDRRPRRRARKADVLATIRRMGALQIDTIQVVARSPYLVLWSRLGAYEPRWLDQLLAEGALFEYWSHAACLLPIEDYPLYRRRMLAYATPEDPERATGRPAWIAANREAMERMLELVRERGPVRSVDFEREDGQKGGWWNWKPDKRVLEMLHTTGELMILRRDNFQRVYDLRERVLSTWTDDLLPAEEDVRRSLALKAVRALGVTQARWIGDYFRTSRRGNEYLLESLADDGIVLRAQVRGWDVPGYFHTDNLPLLDRRLRPTLTTLLSPFDPIVWDRERARAVFHFDYTIECYTPAPKRRYGYFTLPILHRAELIGRVDAKAHRIDGIFEVKQLHLEPGVKLDDGIAADIAQALHECAEWHRTPTVVVRRSDPPAAATLVQRAVDGEASGALAAPGGPEGAANGVGSPIPGRAAD
jgi:uncharacterized protein